MELSRLLLWHRSCTYITKKEGSMKVVRIPDQGSLAVKEKSDYLQDLFNEMFEDKYFVPWNSKKEWNPSMDIYEKDGNYLVKADVPGIEEKYLKVEIKDNVLTISGHKEKEKETKDGVFYQVERFGGSFTRSLTLPEGVEAGRVWAKYHKGVLTVTLPKPKQAQPKKIEVKAG